MLVRVLSGLSHHSLAEIPEPTSRDLMNLVKTDQPIKLGWKLGVKERDFALIKMNSWKMYSLSLHETVSEAVMGEGGYWSVEHW